MEAAGKPKVVEIRIHGVGGEPASHLLSDPNPHLIAGDDISGFHRPGEEAEWDIDQRERQALCWGGNTSGSWKNAFWILLLPFSLVNVAGYMHDPKGQPWWRVRWLALTVTISSVVLAAATSYDLVAIQCGSQAKCLGRSGFLAPFLWKFNEQYVFIGFPSRRLALATVAPLGLLTLLWFAGKYAYKDLESYLNKRLLGDAPTDSYRLTNQGFWNGFEPAFRARLIHLVAGRAAIAGVLVWSVSALEGPATHRWPLVTLGALSAAVVIGAAAAIVASTVHRAQANPTLKDWLARLQIFSWLVLGGAMGFAAAFAPWAKEGNVMRVLAALLGIAVVIKLLFPVEPPKFISWFKRISLALNAVPFLASLSAGILFFPTIVVHDPSPEAPGTFFAGLFGAPYVFAWAIGGVQLLLILLMLFNSPRPERRGGRGVPFGPHWRLPGDLEPYAFHRVGSAVLSLLAVFMILAVAAGVHRGLASLLAAPGDKTVSAVLLNTQASVGEAVKRNLVKQDLNQAVIPWWHETTAEVLVVLILALIVAGLSFKIGLNKKPTPQQLTEITQHVQSDPQIANSFDLNDPLDGEEHLARLHLVFKRWAMARQLVKADLKVFWATLISAIIGFLLLVVQAPESTRLLRFRPDWDLFGRPFGPVATFCLWVVGLLPVVAVLLLRAAAQKENWRKQIGRLWDVLMFWPRSIQPFAPPCYSERVVPQVRLHIDRLHKQGRHVVLAGHSQGSVIAAAAVAMGPLSDAQPMKPEGSHKLDLVVYGSPIPILYERAYPAYFDPSFYSEVENHADSWHHCFARSDIFAYPFWAASPADVTTACPVCGYFIDAQTPVTPTATRTDYVLIDPIFWDWALKEPPRPRIEGHSTYAAGTHLRFEEHLQTIATKAYDQQ